MDIVADIASFLILTVGLIGMIFNVLIVGIFIIEKPQRTAFNLICVARAFNNAFVLFATFLMIFFVVSVAETSPYPEWFEFFFISFGISLYLVNEYTTIVIAVNRFMALYTPSFYARYFGLKSTSFIVGLIYLYRITATGLDMKINIPNHCLLLFSKEHLTYFPYFSETCIINGEYTDIINVVILFFIFVVLLNIATFVKIAQFVVTKTMIDLSSKNRMRQNAFLFLQTLLQDSLVLIDMTFTFKLGSLSDSRFWTFVNYVLVWETIHMLDGIIMIMFNERISIVKKYVFPQSTVVSIRSRSDNY